MLFLQELTPVRRYAQEKYINRLKTEAEMRNIIREPWVEIQQIEEDLERGNLIFYRFLITFFFC